MAKPIRQHYHLVTAEIVFRNITEENGPLCTVRLNGIITDAKSQHIPHRLLGKAQQVVQLHFHNRMAEIPGIEVVDVVLLGFSYLGFMTEEEFQVPPEGVKLQAKEASPSNDPLLSGSLSQDTQ